MKCPTCSSQNTRVLETRTRKNNEVVRRRTCTDCDVRWSTVEYVRKDTILKPGEKALSGEEAHARATQK